MPNTLHLVSSTPATTGERGAMRSSIGVRPGVLTCDCGVTSSMRRPARNSLVILVTVIGERHSCSDSSLRVMDGAVQIDRSTDARLRSLTSLRLIPAFRIK